MARFHLYSELSVFRDLIVAYCTMYLITYPTSHNTMVKSKASTVTQLLLTAFSMLIIPIALFFVGRWYLFAGLENTDVYSAVIAILAVSKGGGCYHSYTCSE